MRGPHPAYGDLVRTYPDPGPCLVLNPPRRARVTTELYDSRTVTLELDVVARAKGWVCVRQNRSGGDPWNAWIPSARAVPLD